MIIHSDSFDHYTDFTEKYDDVSIGGGGPTISSVAARTGIQGARFNGYATASSFGRNTPNKVTIYAGFAFNWQSSGAGNTPDIFGVNDGGSNQANLSWNSSRQFIARRAANVLGTSTLSFSSAAWHYVEVKIVVDSVAGIFEVKVDGVFFLQLTGLNTQTSTNAWYNNFYFGSNFQSPNGATTIWLDDIYVLDNTGTTNNTYLGDVQVNAILPTSNGTENDFTRGGTSIQPSNYQQVDDNPPDEDTSYVYSSTIGNIDRYGFPVIVPTTGNPYAAVLWNRARKDASGTRLVRGAVKSGATLADSGTDLTLGQSYQYMFGLFETDPSTGLAWTIPGIQAAEFGMKVTG